MKYSVNDKLLESDKPLNLGEIFTKLEFGSDIIGGEIEGEIKDFYFTPDNDAKISPIYSNSEKGLLLIRHSAAHVLAEAVQSVYPETKVTIGPVIDDGFYYDFYTDRNFTEDDLILFENKMEEIIKKNISFVQQNIDRQSALKTFSEMGEKFKEEIINDLEETENLTIYKQGEWFDLCRGPHAPNTSFIKSFKLLSVAGSYWRGDETRESLQRIYGTAFFNSKDLKKHLKLIEEAKKRDHRKLGKELDLFSINDEIGPGLVLWHPNGSIIRNIIENYWREKHIESGYQIIYTPHIAKANLWETSGHLEFYSENMFSQMEIDTNKYQTKPMNCPFHIMIYKNGLKSYRDLPIKYAEIGTVYRYERSGVLHGLFRARGFTQDDAHIFCSLDQIEKEVIDVMDLTTEFLNKFGFSDYEIFVSTKPKKYVGTDDEWESATNSLKKSLDNKSLKYSIDDGGGAFYGPKIDLKIKDVLGRSWQCSTVQVDFNLPRRFDLEYISSNNERLQPVMIHRAIFGSFERFFGILIEHYGGAFPAWLAPNQIKLLSVSDDQVEYVEEVSSQLASSGIRVGMDNRNEKLGLKIRESEISKVPFIGIVGNNELENKTINIRKYGGDQIGELKLKELTELINNEISGRVGS
jgi:threonyl-tRNA synthetase|tara:strand:- start:67377 stop:69284 length:1908 start_codon:yes stop_codon:yes gene_type:complete